MVVEAVIKAASKKTRLRFQVIPLQSYKPRRSLQAQSLPGIGWLHIFNADALTELVNDYRCPPELAARRPALALALDHEPRTAGALNAERKFWEESDRRRIQILERHLRPYVSVVRKARFGRERSLSEEHGVRIDWAHQ